MIAPVAKATAARVIKNFFMFLGVFLIVFNKLISCAKINNKNRKNWLFKFFLVYYPHKI